MLRGVEMLGGMLVFRVVAATDVTALLADAQVDPRIAQGHALGADMLDIGFERGEVGEVLAGFGHDLKVGNSG